MLRRIYAINHLYFTKDEVDVERTKHTSICTSLLNEKNCRIEKVFIDNDSAFNVSLNYILKNMHSYESHTKPSTMMVKTYDSITFILAMSSRENSSN